MRSDILESSPDMRIKLLATSLDDIEKVRIANNNRLYQLTRNEPDEDGIIRGLGLSKDHITVKRFSSIVDQFEDLEHRTILALQNEMKHHPLGQWMQDTPGIGLKQGARLLSAVAPIRWNGVENRERTISELWSFCGLGLDELEDGTRVIYMKRKGEVANWSGDAKKRAWLVATSCVKALSSPYRTVYDNRRTITAERVHKLPCVRCGPSGHPALPGSPLSAGHQHADALRIVSKAVLRDMWRQSDPIDTDNVQEAA